MTKRNITIAAILSLILLFFYCKSPTVNNWEIKKDQKEFTQVIFFGDSLTSGYGLKESKKSFPIQLSKLLKLPKKIYGYPGNTTGDGLKKIKNLTDEAPSLVILTLGGNDILRRRKLDETKENLDKILKTLQEQGHTVVYTEVLSVMDGKRHLMHIELCKKFKIALVPDILSGMLSGTEYMQADSIHPNGAGCQLIAERIMATLQETKLLD